MDNNVTMKFIGDISLSAMKPYKTIVDELKKVKMSKFDI